MMAEPDAETSRDTEAHLLNGVPVIPISEDHLPAHLIDSPTHVQKDFDDLGLSDIVTHPAATDTSPQSSQGETGQHYLHVDTEPRRTSNDPQQRDSPDQGRPKVVKFDDAAGRAGQPREKEALCKFCQGLDIRLDMFRVKGIAPRRTGNGASVAETIARRSSGFLKTSSKRVELGALSHIHDKRGICPICALIWASAAEPKIDLAEWDSIKCSANWELDGRGIKTDSTGTISEANNLTRRIHIQWSHERLEDAYIVLVTTTRYVRPNSDAPRSWGAEHLFLARPLEVLGKNQALINSWVTACDKSHGERCRISHDSDFYDLVESSYFGVIDVRDLKLDRLRESEPYAALSYVWGKGKKYTTVLNNVLLHRNHGGIEANLDELPDAIIDAIEVCRKLHIRYLWVDSLCIVQDSKSSWRLNAAAMDLIYGNAHLTICAADGVDASAGLVAIRKTAARGQQLIKEYHGLRLTFTKLAETGIQKSEWNNRAWTFCERMLSKRCLIFSQGHVYFQCRSTAMSEDIIAEPEGAGWSLGLVNAPLQLLRELKQEKRPFWVYMKCVELYTKRKLTFGNDILHAFAGMANLLSEKMQTQMLFGLPNTHFDLALLWTQTGPMKLRRPQNDEDAKRWGGDEFPSWAWSGWERRTGGDEDLKHPNAAIEYNPDMIDGCLRNVNEWLTKHTWIRWYIRDSYGDLRKVFHDRDRGKHGEPRIIERVYLPGNPPHSHRSGGAFSPVPPVEPRHRQPDQPTYGRHFDSWNEQQYPTRPALDNYGYPLEPNNVYHQDRSRLAVNDYNYPLEPDSPYHGAYLEEPESKSYRTKSRLRSRRSYMDPSQEMPYRIPPPPEMHYRALSRERPYRRPSRDRSYSPPNHSPPSSNWTHRRTEDGVRRKTNANFTRRGHRRFAAGSIDSDHWTKTRKEGYAIAWDPDVNDHDYRRKVNAEIIGKPQDDFYRTTPEHPFNVTKADEGPEPDVEFPDQRYLQFHTWTAWLRLVPHDDDDSKAAPGMARFDIADETGDWVGTIVLDEEWESTLRYPHRDMQYEFLALSEAKAFTEQENPVWTYYIPKERHQSQWDLYFAMMIVTDRGGIARRIGLGKVFKAAFENAYKGGKVWKEIILQ